MIYTKYQKASLIFIGVVLIIMGVFAFGYNIYYEKAFNLFWLCYIGLILMGIGSLMKSGNLLISQINILTIPALVWAVDFIYYLIFNHPLLGISNYFFASGYTFAQKIISLQHMLAIPLALYALSIVKIRETDMWIWSFGEAVIVYVLTLMFTNKIYNINYINSISFLSLDLGKYYPLAWIGIAFIGIFVTNDIITRFSAFNRYE